MSKPLWANILAMRYARAFDRVCQYSRFSGNDYLAMLSGVEELYSFKEAVNIMKSPIFPKQVKKELLSFALEKRQAHDEVKDFIFTVLDLGREIFLPEIIASYRSLVDEKEGIFEVTITSAIALTSEVKKEITLNLEKALDKKIRGFFIVKEEILGGLVINFKNHLLDLSLKAKLKELLSNARL